MYWSSVITCLIVVIWLKRSSIIIFTALNSMVMLVARQGITGVHSGADAESLFPCQSKRGYEFGGLFASGERAVRDSAAREVSERHFWLLIEISGMHSEKVINALREHLVMGYTRREACEQHGVSQGYLSGALVRIQHLSQTVNNLLPYYVSGLAMNHEEEGDRSVKRGGDWRV